MGVFRMVRRTEEGGFKDNGRVQRERRTEEIGFKDNGRVQSGEKDRGGWLQGQWACSEW